MKTMTRDILRWGIVCLGALLVLPAPADEAMEAPVLRLVTYNIHHAEGRDKVLDLDRIVSVVLALQPDVVCLQEVDRNLPRTQHLDFPALLSEKLGMPGYFTANYKFQGGEYGNATFSKLPLLSWKNEALPGGPGLEPRGCLETVFDWSGGPVTVWNTHLGLKPAERDAQVTHILAHGFPDSVIFCGDMNENTKAKGLAKVVAALGEPPELRWCDDPSFPTLSPRMRIDHVFAGKHFHVTRCEVVRNEISSIASDHLPIVAELRRAPK